MTAPYKKIVFNKLVLFQSATDALKWMQHPTFVNLQVRHRKPLNLGRAPTKKADPNYFKKSFPSPEDEKHSEPIYSNYNSAMLSIVAAFQEELLKQQQKELVTEKKDLSWDEETHHKHCMDYIKEVNKRLQEARSERLTHDRQLASQEVNDMFDPTKPREADFAAKLAETEQEASNWMTFENCEEKLVEAIDSPINVNFAVDDRGFVLRRTGQVLKQ